MYRSLSGGNKPDRLFYFVVALLFIAKSFFTQRNAAAVFKIAK